MKVTFYGSSDDNFCVEGDDRDEWGAYNRPRQVRTSTGLVVEGEYSPDGYDGKWQVRVVGDVPPGHKVTHVPAVDPDDEYSDLLTVEGPFEHVKAVLSTDEIADRLEDYDWKRTDDDVLQQVASVLGIV